MISVEAAQKLQEMEKWLLLLEMDLNPAVIVFGLKGTLVFILAEWGRKQLNIRGNNHSSKLRSPADGLLSFQMGHSRPRATVNGRKSLQEPRCNIAKLLCQQLLGDCFWSLLNKKAFSCVLLLLSLRWIKELKQAIQAHRSRETAVCARSQLHSHQSEDDSSRVEEKWRHMLVHNKETFWNTEIQDRKRRWK